MILKLTKEMLTEIDKLSFSQCYAGQSHHQSTSHSILIQTVPSHPFDSLTLTRLITIKVLIYLT